MDYKIKKYNKIITVEGSKIINNKIKTTKYNIYNIIPLSIFYQFTNLLYVYYLIGAILVFFFGRDPYNFLAYLIPLVFVVCISLTRDYLKEYKLYKANKEINTKKINKFVDNKFIISNFEDLKQGDIIELNKNDILPADLLVLCDKDNNTSTYIGTSNLDGEKSLKQKKFNKNVMNFIKEINFDFSKFNFELIISKPNINLKDFNGHINIKNENYFFNIQQYLPRESKLKDDKTIYALVVYVGHETKIMLKTKNKINKKSKWEKSLNFYIIFSLIFQLFLIILTFILNYVNNKYYFGLIFSFYKDQNLFVLALVNAIRYFLFLSAIISTALAVTLELLKDLLSLLIHVDEELIDKKRNVKHKIFSEDIIEDLGQIEYLLSDKTGTLTINKMELKFLNIGFNIYDINKNLDSSFNFESLKAKNLDIDKNLIKNNDFPIIIKSEDDSVNFKISNEQDEIFLFILGLVSCQNLILLNKNDKKHFNGESQEEISIIKKLKVLGIIIKEIDENIIIVSYFDEEITIKKIGIIEFDNIRKMMSNLVKIEYKNKSYNILFSKGADSSIYDKITTQDNDLFFSIKSYTQHFSESGLRSLTYGFRLLSEKEVNKFIIDFNNYNNKIDVESLFNWENNLYLSGNVYIEDKILPKINKTIEYFKNANIKFWVLTGDKLETTLSISLTCGIIKNINDIIIIENSENLNNFLDNTISNKASVILHGNVLPYIFNNSKIKNNFFKKIENLESCLFCRLNPYQKKAIAEFLKNQDKIVAAIGDGANDIPMLQVANIGIGIYGKEGKNAANNSDFGISHFNKLKKLIFFHGRLIYLRVGKSFLFFFYKNTVYIFTNFFFGFYSGFTSNEYFILLFSQLYNIILTTLNYIPRAWYEQDVTNYKIVSENKFFGEKKIIIDKTINEYYPFLYEIGKKDKIFNHKIFYGITVYSIIENIIIFLIVSSCFYNYSDDFIINTFCLQTSYLLNVNLKLFFKTNLISMFHILTALITSIILYFFFLYLLNTSIPEIIRTFNSYMTNLTFYLVIIWILGMSVLLNLSIKYINTIFYPSEVQIINQFIKLKNKDFDLWKYIIDNNNRTNRFHSSLINKY